MAAITRPTMTLFIQSGKDEANVIRAIEHLGKNQLISYPEILVIDNSLSTKKSYLNENRKVIKSINIFLENISVIKTDIVGYIPASLIPSSSLPKTTSNFLAP